MSARETSKTAHGALMLWAWGVLVPAVVLLGTVGRETFPSGLWFFLHRAMGVAAAGCTIGGIVLAKQVGRSLSGVVCTCDRSFFERFNFPFWHSLFSSLNARSVVGLSPLEFTAPVTLFEPTLHPRRMRRLSHALLFHEKVNRPFSTVKIELTLRGVWVCAGATAHTNHVNFGADFNGSRPGADPQASRIRSHLDWPRPTGDCIPSPRPCHRPVVPGAVVYGAQVPWLGVGGARPLQHPARAEDVGSKGRAFHCLRSWAGLGRGRCCGVAGRRPDVSPPIRSRLRSGGTNNLLRPWSFNVARTHPHHFRQCNQIQ
eukprot:m.35340 g.35340  ORF g.35340 m.35340 type:complete len:315 (+) comp7433_c0_seq2:107-1051(+)